MEKLRKRIQRSGYKLEYIAETMDITRQSLTNKLDKKSEFKASEISKLSKLLGLTLDEQNKIFF